MEEIQRRALRYIGNMFGTCVISTYRITLASTIMHERPTNPIGFKPLSSPRVSIQFCLSTDRHDIDDPEVSMFCI